MPIPGPWAVRRVGAAALALLAVLALTGCYPELDWRPLNTGDGGFTVLMPARSQEDSRPIAEGAGGKLQELEDVPTE